MRTQTVWNFNLQMKNINSDPMRGMNGVSINQLGKGIQLLRNWFTSRESEHSSCNGQEKALQIEKIQLKNDQNTFSFLMKSFY